MLWLALAYFLVIAVIAVLAVRDDWGKPGEAPYLWAEGIAHALLIGSAATYWLPAIREVTGPLLILGSLSIALAWLLLGTIREVRKNSVSGSRRELAAAVAFYILLYSPASYWALESARASAQNGT